MKRLLECLELFPDLGCDQKGLMKYFGKDYTHFERFFRPLPKLMSTWYCSHCQRHHKIHLFYGEYLALTTDPQICNREYKLEKEDLIRMGIKFPTLYRELAKAYNIEPKVEALETGNGVASKIGTICSKNGESLPVIFAAQRFENDFEKLVKELVLNEALERFVLLAPSDSKITLEVKLLLRRNNIPFVTMTQSLSMNEFGNLCARQTLQSIVGETPERLDTQKLIPLPEHFSRKVCWEDLKLKFIKPDILEITLREQQMYKSFKELGMEDRRTKKPDNQWTLLKAFALEQGSLSWKSVHASPSNKKRKQRLNDVLKKFFCIEGDPIVLEVNKRGWECAFQIERYFC